MRNHDAHVAAIRNETPIKTQAAQHMLRDAAPVIYNYRAPSNARRNWNWNPKEARRG